MKRIAVVLVAGLVGVSTLACGSSSDGSAAEDPAPAGQASTTIAESTTTTAPDPGDPGDAAKEIIELRATGQDGPAWDRLVPQQQSLVPRTKFLQCGGSTGAVEVESVDIIKTYTEEVMIPGTDVTVNGTTVNFKLEYTIGGQSQTQTTTMHLVDVDGEWRWMTTEDAMAGCV